MRRVWGVVLGLALVAGCGVRPSGVITGGPAPTQRAAEVTLYFLKGSTPTPVLRAAREPLLPEALLRLLQQGPDAAELAGDLTTAVPSGPMTVTATASGGVEVRTDVPSLPARAADQVTCTLRDALPTSGPITITGPGGVLARGECPAPAQLPMGDQVPPASP